MAVTFTECREEQVGALRQFFSEMYGPEYILSRDEAFLRWMFGATPADRDRELHIILSLVDGVIRGCVGYIPVEVTIGSRIVQAAWAANWMVDQQYRRLGLGPLLMRELSSRYAVILATGPNDDAADLLPRMGWTSYGALKRYVRLLDQAGARPLFASDIDWPVIGSGTAAAPTAATRARVVERFGQATTTLWDTVAADEAGTRRSDAFLNWRYADHPRFEHRLLVAEADGTVSGSAVFRVEQVRDQPVRLVRILELFGTSDGLAALLEKIAADASAAGAVLIDFFCSSAHARDALVGAGFISDDTPEVANVPMLFQPLDHRRSGILFVADLRKLPDAKSLSWHVTKSDGDQDRPS